MIHQAFGRGNLWIQFAGYFRLARVFIGREGIDHLLVNGDGVVAVRVDGAIETIGDDDMLESARGEILHDQRLKVALGR